MYDKTKKKIMTSETTAKLTGVPKGFKPCQDILGTYHQHGDYFTPKSAVCSHCQCSNGLEDKCVSVKCQKPSCKNYKQVPGKCCDYTCPSEGITDAKTLAIVVTLSVLLVFIIIAIIVVWQKMRRKKKFGTRLETISTSSAQQETDIDSEIIKRNSYPNNLRSQQSLLQMKNSPNSSSSPSCSVNYPSSQSSPSSSTYLTKPSTSDMKNDTKNSYLATTHKNNNTKKNNSSPSSPRTLESPRDNNLVQHEVVACCATDKCCTHTTRRFEPPPPYTPPKKDLAFV